MKEVECGTMSDVDGYEEIRVSIVILVHSKRKKDIAILLGVKVRVRLKERMRVRLKSRSKAKRRGGLSDELQLE